MTQLLEQAIGQVQKLPDSEQDAIAAIILEELADEQRWHSAGKRDLPVRKISSRGLRRRYDRKFQMRFNATERPMHIYTAVIERCPDTGFLVGYVPGFPGAHSQGESADDLLANLKEVIAMLLEDGEPVLESEFVGTQAVQVS